MKMWLKILFMIYTIQSNLIEAIKEILFRNKNNNKKMTYGKKTWYMAVFKPH